MYFFFSSNKSSTMSCSVLCLCHIFVYVEPFMESETASFMQSSNNKRRKKFCVLFSRPLRRRVENTVILVNNLYSAGVQLQAVT